MKDCSKNSYSHREFMVYSFYFQVELLKSNRDTLEFELKSAVVNIKEKFLLALAADGAIDEGTISTLEIGQALGPYQKRVEQSCYEQEKLLTEIRDVHKQFIIENGVGTNTRDALLKQLATSYDVFTELQSNLQEGTKFYNDLTELLIVFQNKISDYCFARKTEKEELMKDLTAASSRQAMPSTLSIPSHHSTTENISATTSNSSANLGAVPYPVQVSNMPIPYGATNQVPYPTYMPLPMPQGFNPYATLPYPNAYQFPQAPQQNFGTWPGPQGGYPQGNQYPHPPH